MKLKAKAGKTFGLLTVIKRDRKRLDRVYWLCKCSCGVIKSVRSDKLGTTTVSCGHYNRELIQKVKEGTKSSLFKTTKSRLFYYTVVKPLHDRIKFRDGNACVLCGTKKNLHVHHIMRKSQYRGLLLEPNNLVTVCQQCHLYNAHSGNTNLINYDTASALLSIVFRNESVMPTPEDILIAVKLKAGAFL